MRTNTVNFSKKQVLDKAEEGISITFAMLLLSYEDSFTRMEAYYSDCAIMRPVKIEKLRDAFGLSLYEAQRLAKLFDAAAQGKGKKNK